MDPIIIKTQAAAAEPILLVIDDEEFKFNPPAAGQLMLLLAEFDDTNPNEAARLVVRFLLDIFDEETAARFKNRFRFLSADDVNTLFAQLVETMTGRPTKSPPD